VSELTGACGARRLFLPLLGSGCARVDPLALTCEAIRGCEQAIVRSCLVICPDDIFHWA